jgi:hypothetical protein
MVSGQRLGNSINQSKRVLEDYIMSHEETFRLTKDASNKLSILLKRLEVYQFIPSNTPYGVFNLSRETFYSTLTVIITYIVVLIKIRGSIKLHEGDIATTTKNT